MPAEVISTIHQLATACKKYKGMSFTNKDGNIIRVDDDEDDVIGNSNDEPRENSEITVLDEGKNETSHTTGVPQINPEGNSHDLEGNSHNPEGNSYDPGGNSHENNGNTHTMDDDADGSEENSQDNIHTTDDDEISIKNVSPEDPRVCYY